MPLSVLLLYTDRLPMIVTELGLSGTQIYMFEHKLYITRSHDYTSVVILDHNVSYNITVFA